MEKVSDYIFRYLHENAGVKECFMLPGGGCMHLVDSLGKSAIRYIPMLHEQACAIAADAAGQYTENLGVALVTAGPGSTNAITGIAVVASQDGILCDSPATPCGACRQVMAQYQTKGGQPMSILLVGGKKIWKFSKVDDILPLIFDSI